MVKFLKVILSASLSMALFACSESPDLVNQSGTEVKTEQKSETTAEAASEPTEQELKELVNQYKNFKALNSELKPSGIHGSKVKTFLDEKGFESYEKKSFPYPDGTMAVKESFSSDGKLNRLYLMKKIKGYDPENNDWYYALMSTEGKPSQSGKVSFCIQCHTSAKDKDYLYGFE